MTVQWTSLLRQHPRIAIQLTQTLHCFPELKWMQQGLFYPGLMPVGCLNSFLLVDGTLLTLANCTETSIKFSVWPSCVSREVSESMGRGLVPFLQGLVAAPRKGPEHWRAPEGRSWQLRSATASGETSGPHGCLCPEVLGHEPRCCSEVRQKLVQQTPWDR